VASGANTTTTYRDISDAKDGSVIAWLTDNATSGYYDLHIGGKNKVYAKNLTYFLSGFGALTTANLALLDSSSTTRMDNMFYVCLSLKSLNISNFNTLNLTDMSWMFQYCYSLNTLNVSNFDTSKVTNMLDMFYGCKSLTSLDLTSFNTSAVTDFTNMFNSSTKLTSIKATTGKWVISSGAKTTNMFTGCGTSSVTLQ
jgi:surface protein